MTLALELEVLERQLSAEIEVREVRPSSSEHARGERAQVVAVGVRTPGA